MRRRVRWWSCAGLLLLMAAAGLLFPGLTASQDNEQTVSDIRIEITEQRGDETPWAELARDLIFLQPGEPFSLRKLQDSIEALKVSNLFREIEIPDPDWDQPAITLTFRLTPYPRIKNILIEDSFPLLEREVLNVMTLYTGDAFNEKKLEEQKQYIRQLYQKEGYIDPAVSLTAETDPADGNVILHVDVDKGPYYSVKSIRLEGNDAFAAARIKPRLETWQASVLPGEMSRLNQDDIDEDIETLLEYYRGKEFAEVEISADVEKDPENRSAVVVFTVGEGPRYDLELVGNEEFWRFTLKRKMVLFKEGNRNGLGLRKSIRNIENLYQEEGYLDVAVETEEEMDAEGDVPVKHLRLVIKEGPRSLVKSVAVSGNRAFDEEKIREQMLTAPPGLIRDGEFVPETLENDVQAIKTLYLQRGYRETEVNTSVEPVPPSPEDERRKVAVAVEIAEGPQTLVSSVRFEGLTVLTEEEAAETAALEPGEPFRPFMVQSDEEVLASRISERGYPYVKVAGNVELREDGTEAAVTYRIDEGKYVEMGETYITGDFRTKRRVFLQEMEIEEGEPFSLREMLESQRNIRDINAIDSVQFKTIGLKEQADEVTLLVNVEEKKPYFFELGIGYDTWRHLYANTRIGDRNVFGLNKEVWAGLEVSQIGYRAELGLIDPRFLTTEIGASATLFAEEIEEFNQDFGIRSYGASVGFYRSLLRNLDANLNFRYEFREQYRTDDSPIPPDEAEKYDPRSILVTTPSLIYDSTDSPVRPTEGIYSAFSVGISTGLQNSLDNFFKYRLEARYYYTPIERLTFALRGRYGFIDPFSSESNIPEDQLFYLGGTSDVRGFEENRLRFDASGDSVGGRTAILGSLEARYDLGLDFELATFYDIGTIRDPLTDAGSDDFRSTVGLGLRYLTPIGPVGLLYGWKLDPMDGESSGELHFSIGYTF